MNDMVSVIMPFFNEEKYLEETIRSILNQTYENIELILINDNSTDSSLDICTSFNDSRIRIFTKGNKKKGAASSRNMALDLAKGTFVAIQDADDIAHPERIAKQFNKVTENPNKLIVGTWIIKIDKKRIHLKLPIEHQDIVKGFRRWYNRVTFIAGTLFCSTDILKQFRYRENIHYVEDLDLLQRLYEDGRYVFYNIPEYLYTYYIRSKGSKAKPDWIDYNYFQRNCQKRRLEGKHEFEDIAEFKRYLASNKFQNLKWFIFKCLDKARLEIVG